MYHAIETRLMQRRENEALLTTISQRIAPYLEIVSRDDPILI